jgi:hypothetical protein
MLVIENPLNQLCSLCRITSRTARRLPRDRPTTRQMLLESTSCGRYPSAPWRVCSCPQHRQIDSIHNPVLCKIVARFSSTPLLKIHLKVNVTVFLGTNLGVISQGRVLWVLISHYMERLARGGGKHFLYTDTRSP